jgi:hypothetical protein
MELFGRVAIIAAVVIVVAAAASLLPSHVIAGAPTSQQAVQYVIRDMRANNPRANITVINVSSSTLKSGSWNIVLSVVYNASRPCPTLFIEGFDYPATNLVPSVDNLYTAHCVIYGVSDAPSYVISSPYIAIAMSYNQSPAAIRSYVDTFGYNNTRVAAKFFPTMSSGATPAGRNFTSVWLINYTANDATYSEYAVMGSSGLMLANYTLADPSPK